MSRRNLTLLLAALLTIGLLAATLIAPVPYVALGAGPTFDTLGSDRGTPVIDISGRQTFPTDGHLDLTTVGVQSSLTLGQALVDWARRDEAVVPRELVFPPGRSNAEVDAANAREMTGSQDAATSAALAELGIPVTVTVAGTVDGSPAAGRLLAGDVLSAVDGAAVTSAGQLRALVGSRAVGSPVRVGYTRAGQPGEAVLTAAASQDSPPRPVIGIETAVTYPFAVKIALQDVGGPSAGLMFALGITDKLLPESLTGGRYVAGTGEITADGVVKPIGGIEQKLVGARRKGAQVFLVPAQNCAAAAANRPAGLRLVKVDTLETALQSLRSLRDGGAPADCS